MPTVLLWHGNKPVSVGKPGRDASDMLRARVLWSCLARARGGEDALSRLCVSELGLAENEVASYRMGLRSLSADRMSYLAGKRAPPGLDVASRWPFRCLTGRSASARQVQRWLSALEERDFTQLPAKEDTAVEPAHRFFLSVISFHNHGRLRDTDRQWEAARAMFEAMPGFCRLSYVQPHTALVFLLLSLLLLKLPRVCIPIVPDWKAVAEQIVGIRPLGDNCFIRLGYRRAMGKRSILDGFDGGDPDWQQYGITPFGK